MPNLPIACQLYTVRHLTQQDFAAAVGAVAEIGYRAVELAGYGSLRSAADVRNVLDGLGMAAVASHVGIDALERNLPRLLDDCQTLGCPALVLSFLPELRRKDAGGWRAAAATLNEAGRACHERGVQLVYHHHHFEFQKFDGIFGLEILWQHTDPQALKAELDTFWLRYAGIDPVKYINRLGVRTELIHLKDLQPGQQTRFAELGTGILDFPAILAAAERAGVKWGIVEQDTTYDRPALESLKVSYDYLARLEAA
jgi:sugar phosphate isomerase/epimerase